MTYVSSRFLEKHQYFSWICVLESFSKEDTQHGTESARPKMWLIRSMEWLLGSEFENIRDIYHGFGDSSEKSTLREHSNEVPGNAMTV